MRCIFKLSLFVILFFFYSCGNKKEPEKYFFVDGVVLEIENIHTGWGYYRQRVVYEFHFQNRKYQQIEKTGKAHIYSLKYHKEDSVLVQIPDGEPSEARLVKVTKRSKWNF
ncbi:MAG: hypothetical protein JXR90_15130 [Spirochaetes bacterium]|nr:hypothetical protein [Spirochaetota bacterium]